jgi:hypothetical protein
VPVDKLCGSAQDLSDAEFVIECWDYDAISEDDLIGKVTVSLKVNRRTPRDLRIQSVRLRVRFAARDHVMGAV